MCFFVGDFCTDWDPMGFITIKLTTILGDSFWNIFQASWPCRSKKTMLFPAWIYFIIESWSSHAARKSHPACTYCDSTAKKQSEVLICRKCALDMENWMRDCNPIPSRYSILIYLHLVDIYDKCRQIYHTWMVWE